MKFLIAIALVLALASPVWGQPPPAQMSEVETLKLKALDLEFQLMQKTIESAQRRMQEIQVEAKPLLEAQKKAEVKPAGPSPEPKKEEKKK